MNQLFINGKVIIAILIFFQNSITVSAQYNNSIYYSYTEFNSSDSQNLYLSLNSAGFINNNEFFGRFIEGYTLIGTHFTPELIYYPTGKLRLKAGGHFLKFYGTENFTAVIPVFTFQYKITPSLSLIFGSLYGTANHRLVEPLYELERYFVQNQENGIQLLLNTKSFFSDTWLNWEKFIRPGDPFQEEFTAGTSNIARLLIDDINLRLSFPIQAIASHKGGQINVTDENVQTIVNAAVGVAAKKEFCNFLLKSIEYSNYYLTYNDFSHTLKMPYSSGRAFYSNLIAEFSGLTIGAGYWYGNQFITTRGMPIFGSVSTKDPLHFEKIRRLFTSKIILNQEIGRLLRIGLRVETYYDLLNGQFDYTYGIHIIYNQRFFLKKIGLTD